MSGDLFDLSAFIRFCQNVCAAFLGFYQKIFELFNMTIAEAIESVIESIGLGGLLQVFIDQIIASPLSHITLMESVLGAGIFFVFVYSIVKWFFGLFG